MNHSEDALPDPDRRRMLQRAASAVGGLSLAVAAYPFLASLASSERARAQGGPVEADLTPLVAGANPVRSIRPEIFVGRVFAGSPAPTNLVVPPHGLVSPQRLVIGAAAG